MSTKTIDYDNQIVRWWVISGIVWGLAAMLFGVIIAFQMVYPALNFGPFLTFGRMRPVHTNGIIFWVYFELDFCYNVLCIPKASKNRNFF